MNARTPKLESETASQPKRPRLRRNAGLLALEQRFMFDGAAVDAAHVVSDGHATTPLSEVPAAVEVRAADPSKDNGKKEVVIVDTSVAGYQTLEAGIREGVGIVEIDGSKDGLAQIAQWAASHWGYDSISILSHGSEATLHLGSTTLTDASLKDSTVQAELATLGQALTAGGDILLYGCDIAKGTDGRAFIDDLAAATSADVAASSDATGAASKGGDWALEQKAGIVEASVALSEAAQHSYDRLLALPSTTQVFAAPSYLSSNSGGNTADGFSLTESTGATRGKEFEPDFYYETCVSTDADGHYYYELTWKADNTDLGTFDLDTFTIKNYANTGGSDFRLDFTGSNGQTQSYTSNGGSNGAIEVIDIDQARFNDISSFKLRVTLFDASSQGNPAQTANLALVGMVLADLKSPNAVPSVTTPTAIILVDTAAADTFSNQTGTIVATDSDGTIASYGVTGGATGGSTTIGSTTYDVSKAGTYGTLYVKSSDGSYVYAPNATAINGQASSTSETFAVTATDNGGATGSATLTVSITGANDTPTDIGLSANSVNQSAGTNATVGALSTTDADSGQSHTYSLVSGTGGTDNGLFNISGSTLRANDASSLSAGTHSVRVQTSDGAGGTYAEIFSITVADNIAPAAPTAPDLATASDSGSSSTDNLTNDTTPTITGTAEANSAVTLYDTNGTAVLGTATADGSGNWSITSSVLAEGNHTLTAKATDAANNTSNASTGLVITIDTTAPAAPGTPDLATASDSGSSTTDNITSNTTPTITGTAAANSTVTLYDGANQVGTATADGSGNWSVASSALAEGNHTLTAKATDAAGNVSAASSGLAITIDTTAATTTVSSVALSNDTGSSNTDFITHTASQTLSGTLSANLASGETVKVSLDNGSTWTAATTTVGSNAWSLSGQTLSASNTLQVKVTDVAGNDGSAHSQAYVLDTAAPTTTIATLGLSNDAGSSSTDFITNTASQTLSGTLSANLASGEIVQVSLDNGSTWTAASATVGQNTWSLAGQTLSASNTLKVKVSDAAGNDGAVSSQAYVLDTTAPAAPSTPDLATASDSGSSTTDNITSNPTPTITGTAAANSTITLYDGANLVGTTTADGSGNWSVVSSALAEGNHTLTAKATDAAGNTSSASTGLVITIDTTDPSALATSVTTISSTLASASSTIASLSATDTHSITYALATGNGSNDADNASFTISGNNLNVGGSALTAGTYHLYLSATDAAGNESYQGITLTVVDAPSVSSVVRTGGASATVATSASSIQYTVTFDQAVTGVDTSDFSLTVTGTAAGTISSISGSGTTYLVTVTGISGDGNMRLDLNGSGTGIQNGSSVAIVGGYAAGATYTLDHTAPAAPSTLDLDAASDSGPSTTDNITSNPTPTITGTAAANSTVTLYDGANLVGTTTADGSGNWSVVSSALSAGVHTLSAKATDAAGNVSDASTGLAITIDTVVPVISLTGASLAYTEKDAATAVDSSATVVETSSPGGSVLTASISANALGSDQLSFATGTDAGINVSGTSLRSGSTVIGTVSAASVSGSTVLTITFGSTATASDIQNTIRALRYANSSADPTAASATRTVSFNLSDGAGNIATAASRAIAITAVHDAPTDIALSGSLVSTYDTGTNVAVGTLSATDPDSSSFTYTVVGVSLGGTAQTTSLFNVSGSTLLAAQPGTMSAGTYSVTVEVSDGDKTYQKTLSIVVDSSLTVTTASDQAYDGGSYAAELTDGGGLSLAEAIGIANANHGGTIKFADTLAGLTVAGAATVNYDTTLDLGSVSGVTLGGAISIDTGKTLTIKSDAGGVTLSGVISGAGGLIKDGAGTLTLSGANTYTGATIVEAGELATSTDTRLSSASSMTVESGATLRLNGANLVASLSGAGNVVLGVYYLNVGYDNASTEFSGAISGGGGLYKYGSGTLTLSGTNSFTGITIITAGTLEVSGGAALADTAAVNVNAGASLRVNASETIASLIGSAGSAIVLNSGTLTLGDNSNFTVASTISGAGALVKTGTGVLTLSGTNTYTGGTTVAAGWLYIGSASAIGSGTLSIDSAGLSISAPMTLANAIVLNNAASIVNTGAVTLSGTISGPGNLSKQGTGTLTLSGSNTFSGGVGLAAGTLALSGGQALADSSALFMVAGSEVLLNDSETIGAMSGDGTVTLGANTLTMGSIGAPATFSGTIEGTGALVIKASNYWQTLSGSNTFTGGLTILGGTLVLQNGAALLDTTAVTVNTGGSLWLGSNETIGTLSGAGNVFLSNNILTVSETSATTFSGAITGSGALVKTGSGTLTLSGANTYSGTTTVSAGTLAIATDANLGSGAVSLAAGTTLSVNGATTIDNAIALTGNATLANANAVTLSGLISGSGDLTKAGAGTLTLSGNNSCSGATTVSAGTLLLNGANLSISGVTAQSGTTVGGVGTIAGALTIDAGATLAPGLAGSNHGVGMLTVGSLVLNGTLAVDIAGDTSYDTLVATGAVSCGANSTLAVTRVNGYARSSAVSYMLVSATGGAAITGTLRSLAEGGKLESGDDFYSVSYVGGTGNDLVLTGLPIPTVTSVSASTANGSYKIGDTITLIVTMDTPVLVTGRPTLALANGGTAYYSSGSYTSSLVFTYTVGAGQSTADLDYATTGALTLAGGTIKGWAAPLDAVLTLATPGAVDSLAANGDIVIDAIRPTASIVMADTALTVGETSLVTITFSEAVTGFDSGDLSVENGTLSGLSSSDGGKTWTATFTPNASVSDTSNLITLNNAGVQDLAGNAGAGTTVSANYAINTTIQIPAPGVEIVSDANRDGVLNAGELGDATSVTVRVSLPTDVSAGDTLSISDGRTTQNHVLDAADIAAGNWTFTLAKPAEGTTLTVTARLSNAVGTVSPSASASARVDTFVPTPTVQNLIAPETTPAAATASSETGVSAPAVESQAQPTFSEIRAEPAQTLSAVYTSAGENAIRIPIVSSDTSALLVYHGIADQSAEVGRTTSFPLPIDAFAHTQESAVVQIEARQADGRALPNWVRFNPNTGSFEIKAVENGPNKLTIRVTARDDQGREVSTIFRLELKGGEKARPAGRPGLTEQLQQAAPRPGQANLHHRSGHALREAARRVN